MPAFYGARGAICREWGCAGDVRGSCQVSIGEGDGLRGKFRTDDGETKECCRGLPVKPRRNGAEAGLAGGWVHLRLLLVIGRRKKPRQDEWKMPKDTLVQRLRAKKEKSERYVFNVEPYVKPAFGNHWRSNTINRKSKAGLGSSASSSMVLSEQPEASPRPKRRSWIYGGPRPGSSGSAFSSISSDSNSFFSIFRGSSTCTLTQPQQRQDLFTPPKTPTPPEPASPSSSRRNRMSVRSMMGALSLFPSNDPAPDKERGRSWSKKSSPVQEDSITDSRASSRSRSRSPFVFRRTRTRDPSPAVGALKTDVDSDYEPSARIRPRNAFSTQEDDETSGDETEGYDDSEDSWSDDHFDPITERNTETNAALISPSANEEGTFADPLGEGVNVVIPPEPYFPSTLNNSTRQPRRRKSTKLHVHDRLPLATSRPVFQRDRCSIRLAQGDPEAALDKRRGRTYMLLSDLSDESRYAMEWGIGTVIRDGDELYVIPTLFHNLTQLISSESSSPLSRARPKACRFFINKKTLVLTDPSPVDPPTANPADRSTKIRNQQEVCPFLSLEIESEMLKLRAAPRPGLHPRQAGNQPFAEDPAQRDHILPSVARQKLAAHVARHR